MFISRLSLAFVVALQSVRALNITFPSGPIAAQYNTFNWIRGEQDPNIDVWLRRQKLDGSEGARMWSGENVTLDLKSARGSSSFYFKGPGNVNLAYFTKSDYPTLGAKVDPTPTLVTSVSIYASGSTLTQSHSSPVLTSSSQTTSLPPSSSTQLSSQSTKAQINSGTIAGISVGVIMALTILILLEFMRRRRRKRWAPSGSFVQENSGLIIPFTPNTLTQRRKAEERAEIRGRAQILGTPGLNSQSDAPAVSDMAGDVPIDLRTHSARMREVIQHEDSGWRPEELVSETDHQPIELPPTYDDSTRRLTSLEMSEGREDGPLDK
ncbi:hypothetical protein L218DRAFT_949558 [Marasmius fiardii PR-910]|nr:hypothetical protein L218DRAFT_949558 [Marasmius fiardii PR-910]